MKAKQASEATSLEQILIIWHLFDSFPMETMTKAWLLKNSKNPRQRSVEQMRLHRQRFGASGNCFDLAIWLLGHLKDAGLNTYYVGNNLGNQKAHVGMVAMGDSGDRYLCDLGDLWIKPVNLDIAIVNEPGYFTGARISVHIESEVAQVLYERSNCKTSRQLYSLTPIPENEFLDAAHISQNTLSRPLIETRVYRSNEVIHWEFENNRSFFSSMDGLQEEPQLNTQAEWSQRIHKMTGMDPRYVSECFDAFNEISGEKV
ncbi:MAG: hypothetical protein IPK04_05130 [Bdellovibrionales bacterium]|nr:hypothetical protein [Bdellovibrionales bacterium]